MPTDTLSAVPATIRKVGWELSEIPIQAPGSRIRMGRRLAYRWGVNSLAVDTFKCAGIFRHTDELICSPIADGWHGRHLCELRSDLEDEAAAPCTRYDEILLPPEAGQLVAPSRIVQFPARWTTSQAQLDLKVGKEITQKLGYAGERTTIFAITWGGHLVLMSSARYAQALDAPIP